MKEHLIFFDDHCPFCYKAVRHIIDIDKESRFLFAPLNGKTAQTVLSGPLKFYADQNSLILIENYQSTDRQFWIRSRAFWRIYWLLGHGWGIIGWFSFFPGFIGDFFYRWLAEHRHQFKIKPIKELGPPERFLP